ncbi:MAG: tRNA (N6-isopentenyl adenosine(37)-C2)-methylthiotransferase MiaB [Candidatus Caldatribacteriota bacterium]|nr:tRNA (N6-isopentenyl adenosine(37)-C2)-methylthiotransferase MiaB [Candidatus Caldatribacteriota bacterium]
MLNQFNNNSINKKQKAYIRTYGCQMNVNDSEYLIGQLKHLNYTITDDMLRANLIILNSCCVRKNVEQKIYSLIGRIKKIKIVKKDLLLGLCGCLAQKEKEDIFKRFPCVDFILGTSQISNLESTINMLKKSKKKIIDCENKLKFNLKNTPIKRNNNISALVQIMRGCNNYCSYCIVPYTRGPEQSRGVSEILNEANNLVQNGYKEIFLLGQNVNSYGQDLTKSVRFSELLKLLNDINDIVRIRFITSHPKDLSFDLIKTIKNSDKICNHIHLPIQSGSDKILKLMNRKYDTNHYKNIVNEIRDKVDNVSITTDVMVGFPGETDKDFSNTLNLFEEIKFDGMYSFIYSNRETTVSSLMPNQIPLQTKKERLWKLSNLQKVISNKINEKLKGKVVNVLVKGYSQKNIINQLSGKTDTNKSVIFNGEKGLIGKIVKVRVIESDAWTLFGELVN